MGIWYSTDTNYETVKPKEIIKEIINGDPDKLRYTKSEEIQVNIRTAALDKGTQICTATVSVNGTQTPVTAAVSETGTQTHVKFTDRLTGFGTIEVGSTEAFEHVCDTCDPQDHEAVGFCKQCDQFYCFNCCKNHENITSLRNHYIVAKHDFTGIVDERQKLFAGQIVPFSIKNIEIDKFSSNFHSIALSTLTKTIVVLDQSNYHAMYLRSTYLKVINQIGSDKSTNLSKVFHMILLSESNQDQVECFLTLPSEQQVHKGILNNNPLKPVPYFKTSGECWGIAEFDDGFAVSVKLVTGYSLPDWQVQYLDAKGSLKKQIYYDNHKNHLFSKPEYLASNTTHDTLYVSDCGKHEVIALDVFGNVLFTFSHNDLKNPRALTVDDEDNVYVACGNNVVQIHKSGSKHRVLIQKNKHNPDILSVCFNTVSRTLIVGEASSRIKTFNFLPQ